MPIFTPGRLLFQSIDPSKICWPGPITVLPSLRNKHTSGMALFRDLLTRRSLLDLFAKFAHNILQVFYAEPMLQMIAMTDYVFGR